MTSSASKTPRGGSIMTRRPYALTEGHDTADEAVRAWDSAGAGRNVRHIVVKVDRVWYAFDRSGFATYNQERDRLRAFLQADRWLIQTHGIYFEEKA